MTVQYNYDVNDFANNKVVPSKFIVDLNQSTISGTFSYMNTAPDIINIFFEENLTASDKNTLDVLVTTHSGIYVPPTLKVGEESHIESENELSTTSSTWQKKARLSLTNLPAGFYEISWYYEYNE